MRIGETSLRVTSLLASGLRRPKFRTDLKVSRQVVLGEVSYVVKVPETERFYRFEEFEWETLQLFDGKRTYREAWEELRRRDPGTDTTLGDLEDYLSSVDASLWEKTPAEKNLAILEKIRAERKHRGERSNIFYLSFSAFNPDPFFNWIHPYIRWIWTRQFVYVSIALFILGGWVVVDQWARFKADTSALYSFQGKSFYDLFQFWVLILATGFLHECGHGLTCKNYGGEVKQMGFMLIFFMPAFFTNVSDSYLFDKDSKRYWTVFGGIWIEAVVSVLALFVWMFSIPGTTLNDWAYKTMLLTAISGIFINLNPLMKLDGYYVLSQLVQIDNLREEAFAYLKKLVKRYLFGMKVDLASVGRRKRRIFLIFGPLALLYSITIVLVVIWLVKNWLTTSYGMWGWALTLLFAGLIVRKKVRGLGGFIRERVGALVGQPA